MTGFLGTWKNVPFAHLSVGSYNVQAAKTFSQAKLHKPDTPQWRLLLPWLFALSFLEFTHLSLQKTTQRKVVPEERNASLFWRSKVRILICYMQMKIT